MAKNLAKAIDYVYVDTGAMYRAITLYALANGLIKNGVVNEVKLKEKIKSLRVTFEKDTEGNIFTCLDGKNVEDKIRSMEVSNHVSLVSRIKFVREAMVQQQQEIGKQKGIVMDGRDIGTVVFPTAELKIFLTASPEVRAERRLLELKNKEVNVTYKEVLKNIVERDRIDSTRKESPLVQAIDALALDNTNLSKNEQQRWLMEAYRKATE